ncbi:MAG TPA: diadenylate cyclase CdaA [Terriglobales bacterium]|nr:diadenylate cyclase CdaA [Terriglobales bacterium]
MPLIQSALEQVSPNVLADVAITALLIYWLFSLIRGTRAVRLVVGVCLLLLVYGAAVTFDLKLLRVILQTSAYVGLFALVVVFQPELRRALDRIGRLGSLGWLISPAEQSTVAHIAIAVASAAERLSREGHGALIVIERETGLQEIAENGVMLHADLSADLLVTLFSPKTPLHDGAVVIRGDRILAAGAVLPSAETTIPLERFGTRHKAALGITEQTDAIVVVVSEESGQMSLVERARIVRNLDGPNLERAITALLHPKTPGGILGQERKHPRGASVRALARRARFGALTRRAVGPGKGRGRSAKASGDAETEEKAS